jgi:hypothetical protein
MTTIGITHEGNIFGLKMKVKELRNYLETLREETEITLDSHNHACEEYYHREKKLELEDLYYTHWPDGTSELSIDGMRK